MLARGGGGVSGRDCGLRAEERARLGKGNLSCVTVYMYRRGCGLRTKEHSRLRKGSLSVRVSDIFFNRLDLLALELQRPSQLLLAKLELKREMNSDAQPPKPPYNVPGDGYSPLTSRSVSPVLSARTRPEPRRETDNGTAAALTAQTEALERLVGLIGARKSAAAAVVGSVARVARSPSRPVESPPSGVVVVAPSDECQTPGCTKDRWEGHPFCSKMCSALFRSGGTVNGSCNVNGCKFPALAPHPFCSRTCANTWGAADAVRRGGAEPRAKPRAGTTTLRRHLCAGGAVPVAVIPGTDALQVGDPDPPERHRTRHPSARTVSRLCLPRLRPRPRPRLLRRGLRRGFRPPVRPLPGPRNPPHFTLLRGGRRRRPFRPFRRAGERQAPIP